jgi:hypothetical protein
MENVKLEGDYRVRGKDVIGWIWEGKKPTKICVTLEALSDASPSFSNCKPMQMFQARRGLFESIALAKYRRGAFEGDIVYILTEDLGKFVHWAKV